MSDTTRVKKVLPALELVLAHALSRRGAIYGMESNEFRRVQLLQLADTGVKIGEGSKVDLQIRTDEHFVRDGDVDLRLAMFAVCEKEDRFCFRRRGHRATVWW